MMTAVASLILLAMLFGLAVDWNAWHSEEIGSEYTREDEDETVVDDK
jgi:hypothetical protein